MDEKGDEVDDAEQAQDEKPREPVRRRHAGDRGTCRASATPVNPLPVRSAPTPWPARP